MQFSESSGHDEAVETAIRSAIDSGDDTVGAIAVRLGDVDPVEILAALKRLGRKEIISRSAARAPERTPTQYHQRGLPVPHPLDYDWRLSHDSVERMSDLMSSVDEGPALLVGVPTVFQALRSRAVPARGAHLYDSNMQGIQVLTSSSSDDRFRATVADARHSLPSEMEYSIAFLDPPWYPDVTIAFLQFASAGCKVGAKIYVSVPGVLTRPNIDDERRAIVAAAADLGMDLRDQFEGALVYQSPPFERRTFHHANIDVPADWRRGTLLRFEKVGGYIPTAPTLPPARDRWEEVTYGGVRFRVRLDAKISDDGPLLHPAAPGGILRSVSRRNPLRATVTVWTSGNSVYFTSGPAKLLCILRALANGESARDAVEQLVGGRLSAQDQEQIDAVQAQIKDIVASECIFYYS